MSSLTHPAQHMLLPDEDLPQKEVAHMAKVTSDQNCPRQIEPSEIARSSAGFDPDEDVLLTLTRYFMESFAMPPSQSWLRAFHCAACHFGADEGAVVMQRLLFALQAMRSSRKSTFCFNAPECAVCSEIVTENERRFMAAITNARRGKPGAMTTELMLLCEGNDISLPEECFQSLSSALPPIVSGHRAEQGEAQYVPRLH